MNRSRLRIGVVAGEASGDILGSRVLAALQSHYDEVLIEGVGGPLMQARGLRSLYPMERLSVMGFVEPLKRLPELLRMRRNLLRHFLDDPPDLFLGIDSPDFTLTLERKLRRAGVPTAHLVSPSVWAWRQGRIRKIKRAVDLMLCLFPFETDIYEQHAVPVRFVGHPIADELPQQVDRTAARRALGLGERGRVLALLPGSRAAEVQLLAPLFLRAAQRLYSNNPQLSFVIPAANEARLSQLQQLLRQYPQLPVTLVPGQSREAMSAADAVLLASGTATLEASLLKRPMVVAYRMAPLSWWLVSRLVKTPYAALPNILAGHPLVPELIQAAATPDAMADAVQTLLEDGGAAHSQLREFDLIHNQLRCDFAAATATALAGLAESRRG
jgi:lipid-A-disaccharide synthase